MTITTLPNPACFKTNKWIKSSKVAVCRFPSCKHLTVLPSLTLKQPIKKTTDISQCFGEI